MNIEELRVDFESWHRANYKTAHQTGQPTRDMHNGVRAEQYGPEEEQDRWEAWQACAAVTSKQFEADAKRSAMRIKELNLLFGRYILAMRAALIEEEHGLGAEGAMMWIYNSLVGPGELPPENETLAQAYFDREIVAVDNGMQEVLAFHDARRAAKEASQ